MNNMTRGLRNNNPANIVRGSRWLGLTQVQPDIKFCSFSSTNYGVRALLYLLVKYYKEYHLISVKDIINRFAPSSDGNDTESYINYVCGCLGVSDNEDLNLNFTVLYSLAKSICRIESNYYLSKEEYYFSFHMLPLKYKNYVKK